MAQPVTQARFKEGQKTPLPQAREPDQAEAAKPAVTQAAKDIAHAPKDGRSLMVFGSPGQAAIAYWRRTRSYNRARTKWDDVAFWAISHTTMKLDFEPRTWTPLANDIAHA